MLSEKIQRLRKKAGLSQEDLANTLNVSRQSVQKWESGQSVPDTSKLIGLSKALNTSVDYLLDDDLVESPNGQQATPARSNSTEKPNSGSANRSLEEAEVRSISYNSIAYVLLAVEYIEIFVFGIFGGGIAFALGFLAGGSILTFPFFKLTQNKHRLWTAIVGYILCTGTLAGANTSLFVSLLGPGGGLGVSLVIGFVGSVFYGIALILVYKYPRSGTTQAASTSKTLREAQKLGLGPLTLENGENYLTEQKYDLALSVFTLMLQNSQTDSAVWYGRLVAYTQNFTKYDVDIYLCEKCLTEAGKTASRQTALEYDQKYRAFLSEIEEDRVKRTRIEEERRRAEEERTRNDFLKRQTACLSELDAFLTKIKREEYSPQNYEEICRLIKSAKKKIENFTYKTDAQDLFLWEGTQSNILLTKETAIRNCSRIRTIAQEERHKKSVKRFWKIAIPITAVAILAASTVLTIEFGLKTDVSFVDEYGTVLEKKRWYKGSVHSANEVKLARTNYKFEGLYLDSARTQKIDQISVVQDMKIYTSWSLLGSGTSADAYKIFSGDQLRYLSKAGTYTLANDIVVDSSILNGSITVNGSLVGANKTITIKGDVGSSLFDQINSSGSVSSLKISLNNVNYTENNKSAILTQINHGKIDSVTIEGEAGFKSSANTKYHKFACGVYENDGTISSMTLNAKITVSASGGNDIILAGICYHNAIKGTIKSCINTASLSSYNVVGICAKNQGSVSDCTNSGSLSSKADLEDYETVSAGIVITNNGSISNCTNKGQLLSEGGKKSSTAAAGIACYNYGTVSASTNSGTISLSGSYISEGYFVHAAAGIVYYNYPRSSIMQCNNTGKFSLNSVLGSACVGGITSFNGGSIENCRNENFGNTFNSVGDLTFGKISGENHGTIDLSFSNDTNQDDISITGSNAISEVGGIVGSNSGTIKRCFNSQVISANSNYCVYLGGIAGWNASDATIINSYNASWLKATDSSSSNGSPCGGIAGGNAGTIQYSFNRAQVLCGSNDWKGGVIGRGTGGSCTYCYWVYFSNGADYGNNESKNMPGISKVTSDADLTDYAKQHYDSTIWDFSTYAHPTLKY